MTAADTLAVLLELREESQKAQTAAARARHAYEEAAWKAAQAIREHIGTDDAVAWIVDGWVITLRNAHSGGYKDNPFSFVRLHDG